MTPNLRLLFAPILLAAAACAHRAPLAATAVDSAHVQLKPLGTAAARGTLVLTSSGAGVHFVGEVRGLTPNARHGFHVHAGTSCGGDGGADAGPHFNPGGAPHGGPGAASHAGDLGNLVADAAGVAVIDVVHAGIGLTGPNALIGHTVIVHAEPDDLHSQPSGNSGARIGCGIIESGLPVPVS